MKKFIIVMSVLFLTTIISACDDPYRYRNSLPELHVIATKSLLEVSSLENNNTILLETDDFGRRLFCFTGDGYDSGDGKKVIAILISQKTDKYYSYFYDGLNYIVNRAYTDFWGFDPSKEEINTYFTSEEFETLKINNDWNKVIDESKLFKVKIDRRDDYLIKEKTINEIRTKFTYKVYFCELSYDSEGNIIILIIKKNNFGYLLFINEDGIYDLDESVEIDNFIDYEEILYKFKVDNGWNFYS